MRRLFPLLPLIVAGLLGACSAPPAGLSAAEPGINVGRAALNGGSADIALQVSGNLLRTSPANAEALLLNADALAALGRAEDAVPAYRAALEANPRSVEARMGLGRLLIGIDAVAAEALFLQALELSPSAAAIANNLGIARDLQSRHADAQEAYRRALASQPSMQAAAVNLALSLGLSGRASEAIPILRPIAAARSATPRIRQNMAAVLAMAGERTAAAQMLQSDLTEEEVDRAMRVFGGLADD